MKYNTGNPVGSADPRDLYDTAAVADNLVHGDEAAYTDRLGKSRKSWQGMEDEFVAFISASGYEFVGDYDDGIELTGYQQILRDTSGEFWRLSGSVTLPYTTTGAGLPEGGNFVAVGDAALRQELNSNASGQGSDLIAHTGTSDTVTEALDKRTIHVGSVAELEALSLAEGVNVYLTDSDRYGEFIIKSGTPPSDAQKGFYIVLSSGNYAERIDKSVITPEMFGGDVSAAASAMSDGYRFSAQGEYAISGSDVVFSGLNNITLDLRGARFTQQSDFSKTIQVQNCNTVKIEGGDFTGRGGAAGEFNGASTSYNGVAGIFLDGCDGVEISGAKLTEHAGGSIVWRDTDNLDIHDNEIVGIGPAYINPLDNGQDFAIGGFSDDPTRMDFVASICNNKIKDTAFGVFHNRCRSIVINENQFERIPGQHAIYLIECSGVVAVDNTIENCEQQAFKMQLENYEGQGIAPAGALNHRGITFTGNVIKNCQEGFAVISTSLSDGTDQKVFDVIVSDNTIYGSSQDGVRLDHCVDYSVADNTIVDAARYGVNSRNGSGKITDNTIKNSGASGIAGSLYDDVEIRDNKLVNCGLNTPGGGLTDTPVFFDETVNPLPSQVAEPVADLVDNSIRFTSGDAASTYLMFFSTRNNARFEGTKTNSQKTVRVDGDLLFCSDNQFVGFNASAQNSPATFLPGKGRRDFHGQQDPQTAGSTEAYTKGDRCWNTGASTTGDAIGWVCVTSGSPGVWQAWGVLA